MAKASWGWGRERPLMAEEYLCDDGGKKLSGQLRTLLDRTVEAAKQSPEKQAFLTEAGHTCTVNMRAGRALNIPRWAIETGGRYIAGGMVYADAPIVEEHRQNEFRRSGNPVSQRISTFRKA